MSQCWHTMWVLLKISFMCINNEASQLLYTCALVRPSVCQFQKVSRVDSVCEVSAAAPAVPTPWHHQGSFYLKSCLPSWGPINQSKHISSGQSQCLIDWHVHSVNVCVLLDRILWMRRADRMNTQHTDTWLSSEIKLSAPTASDKLYSAGQTSLKDLK